MEWKVVGKLSQARNKMQILKVSAPENLNFVIWVKSNFDVPVDCIITPVIEGYIVNHQENHFVYIQKVVPFNAYEWALLKDEATTTAKRIVSSL